MATIITSVSQVLRAYNMPRTTPVFNKNPYDSRVPEGELPDPAMYLSALGTPVVADITFMGGSYTSEETGRVINYSEVVLSTVILTVGRPKRIIKTEIVGGPDGTIKEYINMDDFQVTINGVINGANGVYPFQEVAALHAICEAPVTIPVVSAYLQNFKIFNLVIDSYSMDQEQGGYSKQNFTLTCLSDKPVELVILK